MPLQIGIGINTGPCVVGNMGSDCRFDYSALGDAVNLASRLSSAPKDYRLSLVIGSRTADRALTNCHDGDSTSSRSKAEQLELVFTQLGRAEVIRRSASADELRDLNTQMLAAYRKQQWDQFGAFDRNAAASSQAAFGVDGLYEM